MCEQIYSATIGFLGGTVVERHNSPDELARARRLILITCAAHAAAVFILLIWAMTR